MSSSSRIIRAPAEGAGADTARITRFPFASGGVPRPGDVEPVPGPAPAGPHSAAKTSDLAGVEAQCARLLEETRLKVSEIERGAYEKGFGEGQRAGAEMGEKMGEALLKQYSAGLDALNGLRKEIFATSEREVIRLALEIARKIIKREVAIDEELILTLVKVALGRVAGQTLMTVRVNPKDFHTIERYRAAGIGGDPGAPGESVRFVEDSLIARGGCVIETESGTIDARIEEQLREIERGFFE